MKNWQQRRAVSKREGGHKLPLVVSTLKKDNHMISVLLGFFLEDCEAVGMLYQAVKFSFRKKDKTQPKEYLS